MSNLLPRCPHCSSLTVVGVVAQRMVAVCDQCDNGFAVASTDFARLAQSEGQHVTRQQLENAINRVGDHVSQLTQEKQQALLSREAALPAEPEERTEEQQKQADEARSQRLVYAGVLQGSTSFSGLLRQSLGLPKHQLPSTPDKD